MIFTGGTQADTDPEVGGLPQLALNGDTDSFALCPPATAPGQVNVIYKPTADNFGAYDFDACVAVKLHMVGLE